MPKLLLFEKDNWNKRRKIGKTSKLSKKRKTKSWNYKD